MITCLSEDREGGIWVGTNNNGLFRFNPQQEYFTNVTHINAQMDRPEKTVLVMFGSSRPAVYIT